MARFTEDLLDQLNTKAKRLDRDQMRRLKQMLRHSHEADRAAEQEQRHERREIKTAFLTAYA